MSLATCPACRQSPVWFAAQLTTQRTGVPHFILRPCCAASLDYIAYRGSDTLVSRVVTKDEQPEMEAEWNNNAEKLFAKQTARWTDAERERFRAVLWPKQPEAKA